MIQNSGRKVAYKEITQNYVGKVIYIKIKTPGRLYIKK
jgi:hypothetical protein